MVREAHRRRLTHTSSKGVKRDRAQTMSQMQMAFKQIASFDKVEIKVIAARRAEGGLLVVSDTMVAATLKAPDGRTGKLEDVTREESLWTQSGGTWAVKRVKEIKDTAKINGKAVG